MTTDQKIDVFINQFIKNHKELGWYTDLTKDQMKEVLGKYLKNSYVEKLEVISKMLENDSAENYIKIDYDSYEKQLDELEDDLMTRMERFVKRTK